jgi:hypothetical protein
MFAPAYMGQERRGRSPHHCVGSLHKHSGEQRVKSSRITHFRPTYAMANVGHPSRGKTYFIFENGSTHTHEWQLQKLRYLLQLA